MPFELRYYPNRPLCPKGEYVQIYGFLFDLAIRSDAKQAVSRSAERYLRAIGG
jgi:hypothetical protein